MSAFDPVLFKELFYDVRTYIQEERLLNDDCTDDVLNAYLSDMPCIDMQCTTGRRFTMLSAATYIADAKVCKVFHVSATSCDKVSSNTRFFMIDLLRWLNLRSDVLVRYLQVFPLHVLKEYYDEHRPSRKVFTSQSLYALKIADLPPPLSRPKQFTIAF